MTILSDISIRNLCFPPPFIFDQAKFDGLMEKQNKLGWPLTSGGIGEMTESLKLECTRRPTAEEQAQFRPMIAPFQPNQIRLVVPEPVKGQPIVIDGDMVGSQWIYPETRKIISRGLTSYGYDVSLARTGIKLFTNINSTEIDPKRMDTRCLTDAAIRTDDDGALYFLIPPNSYALGHTVEYFVMPRDVLAICLGKSTYARCGTLINVTPIEPGWEGNVVIEIGNQTQLPARIYLEEGIAQFLFFRGDQPCHTSYADRGGKYMGQTGVTLPTV